MKDDKKTKDQLINELAKLRQRIAELETSEIECKKAEKALREAIVKAEDERARSEAIIAGIGEGISIQDTNFKILYQNQVHKDIVGDHFGEYCYKAYERNDSVCEGCPVAMTFEDGKVHTEERRVDLDDRILYVEITASPLKDATGKIIRGIEVVRDITEHKQAEEVSRHRVQFEELIMSISTHFLDLTQYELDSGTNYALQRIGEFCDVDRSYVFLFSDGLTRMDNTHEWCAEGIEPQIDNLKGLKVDNFIWYTEKLKRLETIKIPRVADLPSEASAEKVEFQLKGIQSLVVVPLVYREGLVGFIGFDSVLKEKTWLDEHISLLKIVGEIFVNALQRKKFEEDLQRNYDRLSSLRNIDRTISSTLDMRVILDVLVEEVTRRLSVDAAVVLLLNPHTQTLEYVTGRGFRTSALQHTKLRLGKSYAGRVALERRLLSIQNLPEDYKELRRSPLLPEEGFVTYYGVPLIAKGQARGVLEIFHRAPIKPDRDWLEFLETLAGEAAIAIDNAAMFENLQRSNTELILSYDATIEGWSKALALRHEKTESHSQNVIERTLRIGRIMGMNDVELVHVHRGALMHDIGKMGIPDSILLKPGALTDEEWEIMRKHPVYAYEMLSPIPFLRPALDIPYCHHEKWDGTGYPRELKGEEIPLAARIFAVVDVLDALLSDRPYRSGWPEKKAIDFVYSQTGKHFDPKVIEAF
jgi:HD-GYP domain-containing protein (c-di-GMP phosphodiesterase class II)